MSDKPSGFFSRWQQRREQVAKEQQDSLSREKSQDNSVVKDISSENQTTTEKDILQLENQDAESREKLLTAEELPDPDKIEIGGSFAVFMGKNIDPIAKKTALRALWKQPHYSEIDGLMEYALDYSNQPLLSAEASSELVKKVFSKIIEAEEKTEQNETQNIVLANEPETQIDNTLAINNSSSTASDKLNEKYQDLEQNVPDQPKTSAKDVIKGQSD